MKLHVVDILIICAYLIVIVLIGLFLKKKAAKNMAVAGVQSDIPDGVSFRMVAPK